MKENLTIVKVGGALLEQAELMHKVIIEFSKIKGKKLLVHGGGSTASEVSKLLGITPVLMNGRRVTSAEDLKVVLMTYAGLINTNLVAAINANGIPASGLNASSEFCILARKRNHPEIDFGFVGDITNIQTRPILRLLNNGVVPIIPPLTVDSSGQMLNTNADTIAAKLSNYLSVHFNVQLQYTFNLNGVLDLDKKTIQHINKKEVSTLIENEIIHTGMLPKLENALDASRFCSQVTIGHWKAMSNPDYGTKISYL